MANNRMVTYRCGDCRKIKRGGPDRRWCDDCGGELKRITYGSRRRVRRAR